MSVYSAPKCRHWNPYTGPKSPTSLQVEPWVLLLQVDAMHQYAEPMRQCIQAMLRLYIFKQAAHVKCRPSDVSRQGACWAQETPCKGACPHTRTRASARSGEAPVLQANAVQVLAGAVAIPDPHALLLQHTRISASADEPQQLLCHTCPPNAHLLCAMSSHQHSNVRSQLKSNSYSPSVPPNAG